MNFCQKKHIEAIIYIEEIVQRGTSNSRLIKNENCGSL